jgi:phosphatidylglycerophosphate synthase
MLDSILARYVSPRLAPVGTRISAIVPANLLTLAAFLSGAGALAMIGYRKYLVALGLLALRGVLDVLDGTVARTQAPTRTVATLDRMLDLVVSAAVPFAFALAMPERALAAMLLMLGLVARAGAGSEAGVPLLVGKTELFLAFALACIFPDRFSVIAYAVGILCFISAGQRVARMASS